MAIVTHNDPHSDATEASRSTPGNSHATQVEPSSSAIAAEAAAIYPDTFDTPPTPEEIAAEAYAIYQARGGQHGRDQDDWLEAERRLAARRGQG